MPDQSEHYIANNIKAFYRRRLFAPALYLMLLIAAWLLFSLWKPLSPVTLADADTLSAALDAGAEYVRVPLRDLKFTGYTRSFLGIVNGYYYYAMRGDECAIILLSPKTSEQGLPAVESANIVGKLERGDASFDALLGNLAADLGWTDDGIRSKVSQCLISEPDYNRYVIFLLYAAIFLSGGYALISLALFLLFARFPTLSPPCQSLALFGNPKKLLAQAEEELATLPQLATEDMFITEHYFIETSVYGNAIVPINEIIWIYKYSTLHKFLWYHFSISYTLHISANRHLYIQCPKNIKSDIDGIIDYLAEANHDILVGFSEQNRLKVQEIQGTPMHFEKFIEFLNRRI